MNTILRKMRTVRVYGFRARAFGAPRNDGLLLILARMVASPGTSPGMTDESTRAAYCAACAASPRVARIGAIPRTLRPPRCRSSVVEHSLGKGEVVSSILTGSTTNLGACAPHHLFQPSQSQTA